MGRVVLGGASVYRPSCWLFLALVVVEEAASPATVVLGGM